MKIISVEFKNFASYGNRTQRIDFEEDRGELYLVLGNNGAGKSSLARVITYLCYGKVEGSNLKDLKDGATVAIPNDPSNGGRALLLLAKQGLIELKDPKNLTSTALDVVKNPKKLKFRELEAPLLPRALADVDLALINTNYAIEAKLNPTKDALFIENADSPYTNIVAARKDRADGADIAKLMKALHSPDTKKFIEEKYKGAVVPAF